MESKLLDLHDIALLLNYERASTEPRFRGAKLREIADHASDFQTIRFDMPEWQHRNVELPKVGYVFDKKPARQPDTPKNMLPSPVPQNLRWLSTKEIETIFWQVRAHDGCFKAVALFQYFFDLFPDDTRIRVRTARGVEYITTISTRVILEMPLIRPNLMSMSVVLPDKTYIQGESDEMIHAVVGFAKSEDDNITTIVDLSSMQFGDKGRGLGGKGLMLIESLNEFYDRIETIADTADTERAKTSFAIRGTPVDKWLKEVAGRAKLRWQNREKDKWCGHCGAPGANSRCSKCQKAYYCDRDHQENAWPFHKKFCTAS